MLQDDGRGKKTLSKALSCGDEKKKKNTMKK